MRKKLQNEITIMILAVLVCLFVWAFHTYRQKEEKGNITVGISFFDVDDAWDTDALHSILQACEEEKISTLWKSASGNLQQQRADIESLMDYHPKYLIVQPRKSVGLKSILKDVQGQTKIILFDGEVSGIEVQELFFKLEADSYKQGSEAADLIAGKAAGKNGRILELQCHNASSETKKTGIGFREKLCDYENLEISYVMRNLDKRIDAYNAVVSYLADDKVEIDFIFAYSDDTAMGAIAALETLGKEIPVVAIGGTQDTVKAVDAGKIFAIIKKDNNVGERLADQLTDDLAGKDSNDDIQLDFQVYKG